MKIDTVRLHLFIIILFLLSGCSTSTEIAGNIIPDSVNENRKVGSPVMDELQAPYEEVWLAALKSIQDYPLANTNKKSGVIETKWIRPSTSLIAYKKYGKDDKNPASNKYKIKLTLLRGRKEGKQAVKLIILKSEMSKRSLQPWREIKTTGIEEYLIRYRIRREIYLSFLIIKKRNQDDSFSDDKDSDNFSDESAQP